MRRGAWMAVLCAAVCALGCDVALFGEVELVGPAARVVEGHHWPPAVSVGVLGEDALVEWIETDGEDSVPTVRWVRGAFESLDAPQSLGRGAGYASRITKRGDHLVAQVWSTPPPEPWTLSDAGIWDWSPVEPGRRSAATLDVVSELPPFRVFHAGAFGLGVGSEGKLPIVSVGGALIAAIGATPSVCMRDGFRQVHLLAGDPPVGEPIGPSTCDGTVPETGNAWLFALSGGLAGLLYRQPPADDGRLRFVRVDSGAAILDPPRVVGSPPGSSVDGGFQPRAVWVDGKIVFTERRGGENTCHAIRVMNDDGTDAHDGPWQLPCFGEFRFDPSQEVTAGVELLAVEGGALLVYAEHAYAGPEPVTTSFPWHEGIYAVLLDRDGRRGSEVVRVTDEGATALDDYPRTGEDGPYAYPFWFGADAEGDRAVVVWTDLRADAPGVYARTLRIR